MVRACAAAAVVLLLAACHRLLPGSARCSASGGTQWRELRSRHFVVDTDLDPAAAAALVADLERIQALVTVALAGEPREIPGYVRVIAPARVATFSSLVPPRAGGYFAIGMLGEPTVLLHPVALRRDPEVIAHELAHHFAWYFFPRQPRWFAEGLAQFVQTVASDTPPYANAVGVVPRMRARALRDADQLPARWILGWRGDTADEDLYQLWSWVLYHWLWNQRPRQLADFQRRLAGAEDPAAAWTAAFPDLDPSDAKALEVLDSELDAHRRRGELVYYRVTAAADAAFTEVPLPPADVHVLLAEPRGFPPRDVSAALSDDPLQPVALAVRRDADARAKVAALRASAAAHPEDWRAWLLLGGALGEEADADEREAALRRAVELNGRSARAASSLASARVQRGRAAEALPLARRAVELAPSDPEVLDVLAAVAVDLGACAEALSLQQRAVSLARGARADALREHLRAMQARCPPASGAAPHR